MASQQRRDIVWFAIALAIPVLFFSTLPWNPAYSAKQYMDYFFGADVWRVFESLKDSADANNYRDKVHPYFSLFAVTVAKSGKLLGVEGGEFLAYRVIFGSGGIFLFWLFIYRCTSLANAFCSVALLLSTMSVRVWSVLPETFIFGFFTLMLGLNLARIKANPATTFIATLSGTVTNCSLGIFYMVQRMKTLKEWRSTIFVLAVAILTLSTLQRNAYPTSVHFFDVFALEEEARYVSWTFASLPFRAFDFIYSGFVLPLPQGSQGPIGSQMLWKTFVESGGEGYNHRTILTIITALIAITVFLIVAAINFARSAKRQDIGVLIVAFLIFELLLHLIYGPMPFLYSYHYLPFLVIFFALYLPDLQVKPLLLGLLAVCVQEANFGQWDRFRQMFA